MIFFLKFKFKNIFVIFFPDNGDQMALNSETKDKIFPKSLFHVAY